MIERERTDMILKCFRSLGKQDHEEYEFNKPYKTLRQFVGELFSSHYMEMVKQRVYNFDGIFKANHTADERYTLRKVFHGVHQRFALTCPFLTNFMHQIIYGSPVHSTCFPEQGQVNPNWTSFTSKIIEFNSEMWKKKKDLGRPLNTSIEMKDFPHDLLPFKNDLMAMHRIIFTT